MKKKNYFFTKILIYNIIKDMFFYNILKTNNNYELVQFNLLK